MLRITYRGQPDPKDCTAELDDAGTPLNICEIEISRDWFSNGPVPISVHASQYYGTSLNVMTCCFS